MPDSLVPYKIDDLFTVMKKLLDPNRGCPWDLKQTPKSIAPFAIEEAHELAEALEAGDENLIKEELGDLLLQVVFQSCLAERDNRFTFEGVLRAICTKLIRRHPHVFANVKVADSEEVLKNWDLIKREEKSSKPKRVFDIPLALPALQRSQKIGDKTKALKFDWNDSSEVLAKVEEEFLELKEALLSGDILHSEEELGDLFFVLAQLARHLKLEAETVARKANQKFERRFLKMLDLCRADRNDFESLNSTEKESLWERAKKVL